MFACSLDDLLRHGQREGAPLAVALELARAASAAAAAAAARAAAAALASAALVSARPLLTRLAM